MDLKEENEKKKEYLWGYQRAVKAVERIEEELRELKMSKIYPPTVNDGMPRGSGGGDLSGYASRVDQMERKLKKARYLRIQKMKEITDRINALSSEEEKGVLTYRYIRKMKWEEIAVKLNHSWAGIHRLHAKALKNFQILKS